MIIFGNRKKLNIFLVKDHKKQPKKSTNKKEK
jgi:hypothetical protein